MRWTHRRQAEGQLVEQQTRGWPQGPADGDRLLLAAGQLRVRWLLRSFIQPNIS